MQSHGVLGFIPNQHKSTSMFSIQEFFAVDSPRPAGIHDVYTQKNLCALSSFILSLPSAEVNLEIPQSDTYSSPHAPMP